MEKTGLRPIVFGPVGFFFFLSVLGYRLLTKARRQRGSEPGNGGGSGEPAALFPTGGAGRVYYSFGGAAAQIHINTAQPGVLRDRFINTRWALPRRVAITKAALPPRTAPEAPLCNCSEEESRAGRARGSGYPRPPLPVLGGRGTQSAGRLGSRARGPQEGGERVEGAPTEESSPHALLLPRPSHEAG